MLVPSWQDSVHIQLTSTMGELAACNPELERYGLSLAPHDIQALVAGRVESLALSTRVEFGGGVVKQLVLAFAGSPHVSQDTFVQTVLDVQDLFYEFKNESLDQIPDEDLITKMRSLFDDVAEGDLAYLEEALFEGLGRHVREQVVEPLPGDDAADPDQDRAAANALTLAYHRFDVSSWVDDTYAPGWADASWLDE